MTRRGLNARSRRFRYDRVATGDDMRRHQSGPVPDWYRQLVTFDRITTDPDVMGGVPCIRGMRIPVATVVAMVADGMTTEEIISDLPDLTPEDVSEALRYAAEALQERELPLRHSA